MPQMTIYADSPQAFARRLDDAFKDGYRIVPGSIYAASVRREKMMTIDTGDGPFYVISYFAVVETD